MNVMNTSLPVPGAVSLARAGGKRADLADGAARTVCRMLDALPRGAMELHLESGEVLHFGQDNANKSSTPAAVIELHGKELFSAVLAQGDIGFAESYIDGEWDSPDLTHLLTVLANNREPLSRAVYGSFLSLLSARLKHIFNANTRSGSRRNIMAHYDLGNDFYRLWLDPTMTYSAALYSSDAARYLAAAQQAKYRRILRRLGIRPGDRVLEIGCGWGGFAETAAREAGAEVHGITLSPAQLEWAQERMRTAGLQGQVKLDLVDYRDLDGHYDHIVSIEMFEAVGERWWPTYFRSLNRLLAPGGRALVQSITIRDELFSRYRRGTDFIQQHVFPGGMLPSPSAFARQASRAGFVVRDSFAFGMDYARTLAVWRENFEAAWPEISKLGYDERFQRLWHFYLSYCEAGFRSGCTDVIQFELAREKEL